MLYNKNRFQKANDKKVLHKVKKQWVTISLAILMAIGGGAAATQVNASANSAGQSLASRIQHADQQGDNYAPGEIKTDANSEVSVQMSPTGAQTQLGRTVSASAVATGGSSSNNSSSSNSDSGYSQQITSTDTRVQNDTKLINSVSDQVNPAISGASANNSSVSSLSKQAKNQYGLDLSRDASVASAEFGSMEASLASASLTSVSISNDINVINNASQSVSMAKSDASKNSSNAVSSDLSNFDNNLSTLSNFSSVVSSSNVASLMSNLNSENNVISSAASDADNLFDSLSGFASSVNSNASFHASHASSEANEISSISNELASLSQSVLNTYGKTAQNLLSNAIAVYGNDAATKSLYSYLTTINSLGQNVASYSAQSGLVFKFIDQEARSASSDAALTSSYIKQGGVLASGSLNADSAALDTADAAYREDSHVNESLVNESLAALSQYRSASSQLSSNWSGAAQILVSLSQSAAHQNLFPASQYASDVAKAVHSASQANSETSIAVSQASTDLSQMNSMSDIANALNSSAINSFYQNQVNYFKSISAIVTEQRNSTSADVTIVNLDLDYVNETTGSSQVTSDDNKLAKSASVEASSAASAASYAASLGSYDASQMNSDLTSLDNEDPAMASSKAVQASQMASQGNSTASSAYQAASKADRQISDDVSNGSSALNSMINEISQKNDRSATSLAGSYANDVNSESQRAVSASSVASLVFHEDNLESKITSSYANLAINAAKSNESSSAFIYAQMAHLEGQTINSMAQVASSVAAQGNSAQQKITNDLNQLHQLDNNMKGIHVIYPDHIDNDTLNNAISKKPGNDSLGIITLQSNNNSSLRYVIDYHPGDEIHIDSTGDNVPLLQDSASGVLYVMDHGQKITQFTGGQNLSGQEDQNYVIHPRMKFYYDNGDGTFSQVSPNDPNITFHLDPGGIIINPQTVSGHFGEPHTITMRSITGNLWPVQYPHFETDTNVFKNNEQDDGDPLDDNVLNVILGEGQEGQFGDYNDRSDNGNKGGYWMDHNNDPRFNVDNWTVPMIARRYFAHVVYTYNGQTYDVNDYPYGFKGDAINNIYDVFSQAVKDGKINSSLSIAPGFKEPTFDSPDWQKNTAEYGKGTINNRRTIVVPLVDNKKVTLQVPVLIRDLNDKGTTINNNLTSPDSKSNTAPAYFSTINLYNVPYNSSNSYTINKATINSPVSLLSQDQIKYIYNTYRNGQQDGHDDPLYDHFLVSGGQLNTASNLSLTNPNQVTSQWTDFKSAQPIYDFQKNIAANVGSYQLDDADAQFLQKHDSQAFQNNEPYSGEIIPILYFSRFNPGQQQQNLVNIPNVYYNARFWEPLDSHKDSTYDQNFVTNNKYLSGITTNTTDNSNQGDKLVDSNQNAYNFVTWDNQRSNPDLTGNLAPDGTIMKVGTWDPYRLDFKHGDINNPDNNWYLRFDNDQSNGQSGVRIDFLKGTQDGRLKVSNYPHEISENKETYSDSYVNYLGIATGNAGDDVKGETQQIQSATAGEYPQVKVSYDGSTQWYPKNATILTDQSGQLCKFQMGSSNHEPGQYFYNDRDKTQISFVPNQNEDSGSFDDKTGGSFYLGDMNTYAQPVSYAVRYTGSGNYSMGSKPTKDSPNGANKLYPGFQNGNPKANSIAYYVNQNGNHVDQNGNVIKDGYNNKAYAGDHIVFIPDSKGQGSFNLIHDGDLYNGKGYQPTQIPLNIPIYDQIGYDEKKSPSENDQIKQELQSEHQLLYDRNYEDGYLGDTVSNEGMTNPYIGQNAPRQYQNDPEWTINSGNPNSDIWPNGMNNDSSKDGDHSAVVYLYNNDEQYESIVTFFNIGVGAPVHVTYKSGDVNGEISTLFHNHKFDMSDLLWNKVNNEQGSFLQSDGSWLLHTPLGGGSQDWYIIRTDAPGQPSTDYVNNTNIYVSHWNLNDSNLQLAMPVTIQYYDKNGQRIDPIEDGNQGAHDFTAYGYLHGNGGSTLDNAINNKIKPQSGNIQNNDRINQTQGKLWNYQADGYHEVGRIPGGFNFGSSVKDNVNNDADSQLFKDGTVDTAKGAQSIFGYSPFVTIVLAQDQPKAGQDTYRLNFVDENDPDRKNSVVANDLNGLDFFTSGNDNSQVQKSAADFSGGTLSGELQSLAKKHYRLDYYTDSAQSSPSASSFSANSISSFEQAANNFENQGQTVTIYLKHQSVASEVTSSASFNERINYRLENASGSIIGSLSAYPGSGAANGSLTFKYQQDLDLVTDHGSGQWHSAGSLSNIVSPANGVYDDSGTKYYANSLSVAAPSIGISGMSLSANANGVSGVSSTSSSNNLTYTYNVVYRPAVPSVLAKTFNETVHYIVHSNGSAAPSAPGDYNNAETFSQKNTYNPWTHQLISAGAWQPQSGSFADQLTSSLSGYQADVSKVAAPSANVMSPNGNANHGQTFSYVVNYYPTHKAKTVTEEISYYLHGKVFNSYQHKVQYNRSLYWSKDHTSPSYTSWSANASDFRDIPTPSVPGYRADKLMISRPDVSQDDINQDFPYQVVYYPKSSASAGDDGNGGHSQPAQPSSSSSSTQPNRPVNPINPDQPVNPSQPNSQPNQPVGSSGSNDSHSAASNSVKPSQPGSSSQPSKPTTPANSQSNRPNRPSRPVNPVSPDQPIKPRPSQPSQPVNPWPSLPTNPVGPSNSDQASSNHSNQLSNGSSAGYNSVVNNPDHNGNNHVNLFSNSASSKRSAGSNSDRYANQTSRHAIKNHRDSTAARHHNNERQYAAKHNGTKSDHQKLTARRAHGVNHHAKRASHTNAIRKHRSVYNHRNAIAKRSNYGRHSRSVKRSSTGSNRHRSIVRQQRKSNRKVGVGRHQARPNRHSVRSQIHRFIRRTHRVIRWVAHQSNRSSRQGLKLHRKVRKAVQSRHYDHADANRLQETIRREANRLGMSSSKLEQLRKTNYRRYRQLLEAHAAALFNHESGNQSRRSGRQYVNGIDDARRGRQFHNYSRDYAAGYNAFRQVTGQRTNRNGQNRNGKLPQTGESHQLTLAAAVIIILSFFLGTSAVVEKRRKH